MLIDHKNVSKLFEQIELYRKTVFEMVLSSKESDKNLFLKHWERSKQIHKDLGLIREDLERQMDEENISPEELIYKLEQ